MPTAMTFDSLLVDLRAYLERGSVSDTTVFEQLPRLVNLAERDIARALKIQGFINVVTSMMEPGKSVYPKPDRWRDTVSINFGVGEENNERTPLFPRSYEYCRMYAPNSTIQDLPEFYADYDYFHWLFAPTPNFAYPFEVLFYQLPPLLDETNQTNWLTELAPNVLLSGSTWKAYQFLKDKERAAEWEANYNRDLGIINEDDLKKIIDRTTSRQEA